MKKVIKMLLVSVALGVSMISTSAAVAQTSTTTATHIGFKAASNLNDAIKNVTCRIHPRYCR